MSVRPSRSTRALFRRTDSPNGLVVVTERLPGVRSAAVGTWVRAASGHESRGAMGVSHLLEHMVFKGTERRTARDIALALEVTRRLARCVHRARAHLVPGARARRHLPLAVDVLGDLVRRPLSATRTSPSSGRSCSRRSRVRDTPDDLVFELHNETLWGDHPYGYSILGTPETVRPWRGATSAPCTRAGYQPGNWWWPPPATWSTSSCSSCSTARLARRRRATSPSRVAGAPSRPADVHAGRAGDRSRCISCSARTPRHARPASLRARAAHHALGRRHVEPPLPAGAGGAGALPTPCFHAIRLRATPGSWACTSARQPAHRGPGGGRDARGAGTRWRARAPGRGDCDGQAAAQGPGHAVDGETSAGCIGGGARRHDEPYRPIDEVLAAIDGVTAEEVAQLTAAFLVPERHRLVSTRA